MGHPTLSIALRTPWKQGTEQGAPWVFVAGLLLAAFGLVSGCATRPVVQAAVGYSGQAQAESNFDVLTQHNNRQRTGANLYESRLAPGNVGSPQFQRLFHWDVDGQIYGQPLYLSHLDMQGKTVNLVIVATMNNSVYAFEAPSDQSTEQPSKEPLWHLDRHTLGEPLPFLFFPLSWAILGYNIYPEVGIVATPVVDRSSRTVYVTAKSGSAGFFGIGRHARYKLFALDLDTGRVIYSTVVKAQVTGSDAKVTQFDAAQQMQRAALLESRVNPADPDTTRIYLAFASHQDENPYHGWVLAYDNKLSQVGVYCSTCGHPPEDNCCEGGIWQAGGGPAIDSRGNVYVMTGNGSFDEAAGDLSTSFIKLDADLHVLGSWTPPNYRCLSETDSDLGSAGPLILPWKQDSGVDTEVLVGGGKEGLLYAIRTDFMQGARLGDGTPLGLWDVPNEPCAYTVDAPGGGGSQPSYWAIQAAPLWEGEGIMDLLRLVTHAGLAQGYHHIHGAPVLWTPRDAAGVAHSLLYVSAERDWLRAYEFNGGFPGAAAPGKDPQSLYKSHCRNSDHGMPGGFLTLTADLDKPDTGILWAAMPRRDKDALSHIVPGVLRAYRAYPDASGKLVEIWNSDQGDHPSSDSDCGTSDSTPEDELGLFAKFAPPTVSEGKVYMATFSNELVVYGVKSTLPLARKVQRVAKEKGYDARLSMTALPDSVQPKEVVAVSIAAYNAGSTPWRLSNDVRLGSRFIPDLASQVVEGPRALQLPRDIQPKESYTFNFHLRAPPGEGIYYYKWQLTESEGDAERKGEGWFGAPTSEWRFSVLRPECLDLRRRAADASAAIRKELKVPDDQVAAVKALIAESKKKGCRLAPENMDMAAGGGSHGD